MHKRILIPLSLIALPLITVTALTPNAAAQRAISAPHFAAGFNRRGFNPGGSNRSGFDRGAFSASGHLRSSFYSLPLYDPLYADFLSSTGYPVASQPPLIILQGAPAAAPTADRFAPPSQPPSQPLMIELQGDHYVRVSGPEASGVQMIGLDFVDGKLTDRNASTPPASSQRRSAAPMPALVAPEPLPALLIFRDGHHEEASEYTIADGILYTRSDPYTSGPWNRKITLSSLNLPETIASNLTRGLRFRVPQSPNEVVVRP